MWLVTCAVGLSTLVCYDFSKYHIHEIINSSQTFWSHILTPLPCEWYQIRIVIQKFSQKKVHLKMWFAKWQPFCSSLHMLTHWGLDKMTTTLANDVFKCIYLNENAWILIEISLKFVPKGVFNNIPALVQIMAWRRPGDKPLSEPMMLRLPTHICITQPQWVNQCLEARTHKSDLNVLCFCQGGINIGFGISLSCVWNHGEINASISCLVDGALAPCCFSGVRFRYIKQYCGCRCYEESINHEFVDTILCYWNFGILRYT